MLKLSAGETRTTRYLVGGGAIEHLTIFSILKCTDEHPSELYTFITSNDQHKWKASELMTQAAVMEREKYAKLETTHFTSVGKVQVRFVTFFGGEKLAKK